MTKRWLLNLALALFVVALALIVKFQPGHAPATRAPALTRLTAESVQTVALDRPGEKPITFARDGEKWRMTAPIHARADRFRLDNLLQLASARVQDHFPATGDLAQFGLDKPLARVHLGQTELDIGGLHALRDLRYVRYGDQIYLVPNASVRAALNPLSDFFSARLLEDDRKPVGFDLAHFHLRLTKGSWTLTPADKNVSSDVLNAFVDEWRYARALSVSRYSGKPVIGRVRITYVEDAGKGGQQKPHTLEFGVLARHPELVLYRADEGLEYHFPQETGDRLMTLARPN